jgi:DNA-binding MarR family transcriptional regulator
MATVDPQRMPPRLQDELHQASPFASPAEEAYLALQRTAGLHLQAFTRLLREQAPGSKGVSPSQYNVLRILRGSDPRALTCGEIGERLVTPGPDVTRLLDRLEERGWVARERDDADRRVVRGRITAAGRDLLAALDAPVLAYLDHSLGHLGAADLARLVRLLDAARHGPADLL